MAESDLLGETVVNFSCSIQTLRRKKLKQSRAKEALIIIITGNTMKLILKVKQPLEKSSNSP